MSYRLAFGPKAVEVYESLPLSLLDQFDAQMDRLAASPQSVAVPGKFPFPENRMVYHFDLADFERNVWFFSAHFRYDSDEITLHVIAVVVNEPN